MEIEYPYYRVVTANGQELLLDSQNATFVCNALVTGELVKVKNLFGAEIFFHTAGAVIEERTEESVRREAFWAIATGHRSKQFEVDYRVEYGTQWSD